MGRGRKPKATAIKEAAGAFNRHPERRNPNEPKAIKGRPDAPPLVVADDLALKKWNHLCEILDELGLLSKSDSDLMAIYSVTWSRWVRMEYAVAQEGETSGMRSNPKLHEANKAADRLYKLGAEFGLNPSSRTRLSAAPKDESDPFLDWLESSKN